MSQNDAIAEIEALLDQADRLPFGPEELAVVRQAADLAGAAGEADLEYAARMRLTNSAAMTGDTDTKLSSFAWCLAKHDEDPDRFPIQLPGGSDLMWQYKWMCGAANRSPAFPLDQALALIDDMETRYRQAGLGMSAVLSERFDHAWATGQIEEAVRLRTLLEATPRDEYSDCDACSRSQLAGFATELGEDTRALSLIDEIVEEGLSCADEPEFALARTLLSMLRAGRFDDAKANHLRSYRLARLNPDNSAIVAGNLVFCAITGNQARALAMAERHLGWLTHDALNDAARLDLLTALALAFESVDRAGHGDQPVRGAERPDLVALLDLGRDDQWTVRRLAPKVWAAADALAAAFDARNGNSHVSDRLATARGLIDDPYDLPIQSNTFVAAPPAPTVPEGPAELLELARSCRSVDLGARAAELADQILAATTPAGADRLDQDPRLEAHRIRIFSLMERGDRDQAGAALAERLAESRAMGAVAWAAVEETAGLALYSDAGDSDPDATARLRAALDQAREADGLVALEARLALRLAWLLSNGDSAGHAAEVAELLDVVEAKAPAGGSDRAAGRALRTQNDADGAEAVIDGLTRCLAEPDLPRGQRLVYLLSRANAYGAVERFEEGLADADEATRLAAALGFNGPGARSAELAGMLTDDAGRPEEAASRLRYAVRLEELEGSRNPSAKFRLARVLYKLDQDLDAAELFADVLEIEQAQQAGPAAIADTLEWLGRARQASGQPGAALSAWAQAVTDYTDGDRPADSIRVLWRMGNLLRLVEDWEEAVDQFDEAVEALDELDWQADKDLHELGVMVLEARALARAEAGLDGAVDDLVLARQTVLADGEAWRAADLIDTKARIMVRLDRPEDAVKEFLESADAYRGAGDQLAGARSELLAAGVLSGTLEREDEARVILEGALRSLADVPPEAAEGASSLIESVQAALSELA